MVLCRFFQQGNCTKGNSCTFEHVRPQNSWQTGGGASNAMATSKYNEASIKLNLTEERPQWKLSVYAPAKEEPNLIVGTDMSCEEDRLLYYTSMRTTGNESQYNMSHEQALNQMETQVNAILNNASGAIQHYETEKKKQSGPFGSAANNAPFAPFTGSGCGAFGSTTTASAFGGGGGAFGQPPAFGQPSAFGAAANKPVSAFGSGSAFGSTSAFGGGSAFGSTSALGGGSAFGSTSALGSGSAFGSTSALGNSGSAFGQPSAFGAAAKPVLAFGAPATTSAFGSTSAFGTSTTAAPTTSAFGATSSLVGGSAFGSTSALGNTAVKPAFGAFGTAAAAPAANAFGSTTATNNVPDTMATGSGGDQASTLDNTSPEWQAFAAPQFTYRAIPEIEPPIQLR